MPAEINAICLLLPLPSLFTQFHCLLILLKTHRSSYAWNIKCAMRQKGKRAQPKKNFNPSNRSQSNTTAISRHTVEKSELIGTHSIARAQSSFAFLAKWKLGTQKKKKHFCGINRHKVWKDVCEKDENRFAVKPEIRNYCGKGDKRRFAGHKILFLQKVSAHF